MKIDPMLNDALVLGELGARVARQRLDAGLTQAALAREAGISKRTLERMEAGEASQVVSLVRVLRALGLLSRLDALVPPAAPGPLAQLRDRGKPRQRAPRQASVADGRPDEPWTWGPEE